MAWITEPNAVLLGAESAQRVKVYHRRCSDPGCNKRLPYTGEADSVFTHSNKYLMRYAVGMAYCQQFAAAGKPMAEHYGELERAYSAASCRELLPCRNTHR
jgi:hypothetical protein